MIKLLSKFIGFFAAFVGAVVIVLNVHGRYARYSKCAVLPNGVVLAYAGLFDLSRPGLVPEPGVKLSNGAVLTIGNADLFYFSETTAYWGSRFDPHGAVAYRADVGLVYKRETLAIYHALVDEAGPLLEEGRLLSNSNVLYALLTLRETEQYRGVVCAVPLFS